MLLETGGFDCTQLVDRHSAGHVDKVLTCDKPDLFYHEYPKVEVFSLQNKIDSGVDLQEVPSVVFGSDSLSESELSKIESVISAPDPDPDPDPEPTE